MSSRHITVITATRADYGLLSPLMTCLQNDPRSKLSIVATGTHLEPRFGHTIDEIRSDGFTVDHEVRLDLRGDTSQAITDATASALSGVGRALLNLKPDIVVILGDRYEVLAASIAAMLNRIPIAHIHGGETTLGAIDESMRHAISKIAHMHFTVADAYATRLIQLGEEPEFVFNVGAPCLDTMAKVDLMPRPDLLHSLGIDSDAPFFLLTYHPETLGDRSPYQDITEITAALNHFPSYNVIVTGVNADHGHSEVNWALKTYQNTKKNKVILIDSLGYRRYISALHFASAVIGNSSSGIFEAPIAGTPTINVGGRQSGRLRAASVIDVPANAKCITDALLKALKPTFLDSLGQQPYPFGRPGASQRMFDILISVPTDRLRTKLFVDIPIESKDNISI